MNKTKPEFLSALSIGIIFLLSLAFFVFSSANAQPITGDTISAIAWSPNQDRIAIGRYNGTIEIKDASNGETLYTLTGHAEYITSLAWSPDGTKLSSSSADKTVRIWDATNGQVLRILAHVDEVYDATWSLDGVTIITNIELQPNNVYIWDSTTGQLLNQFSVSGSLYKTALSPDGNKLLLIIPTNTLEIRDAATFARINRFTQAQTANGDLGVPAWSPDGNFIATGRLNGTVKIWNATTGVVVATFPANEASDTGFASQAVRALQFSPDGSALYSISTDGTIRSWNTASWQVVQSTQVAGPIYAAAFSPDSNKVAYGDVDGALYIVTTPQSVMPPCRTSSR
jgi:WD40 repeat protein